jgi:hypothetical protein
MVIPGEYPEAENNIQRMERIRSAFVLRMIGLRAKWIPCDNARSAHCWLRYSVRENPLSGNGSGPGRRITYRVMPVICL